MQARHGANLSIGTMGKNETDKIRLELTAEDENIMRENVILNRCVTVSLSSASQRKY
jgi:stress response protein YsnF